MTKQAETFYYFAYGVDMSMQHLITMLQESATSMIVDCRKEDCSVGSDNNNNNNNDVCKCNGEIIMSPLIRVVSSKPATISGYRVETTAISREGPRIALMNIAPNVQSRAVTHDASVSGAPAALHVNVHADDRVYGVVHEVPIIFRDMLLNAAGKQGSYNMYATLPCTLLQHDSSCEDSCTANGAGEAVTVLDAIVVSALDIDLVERTCDIEPGILSDVWRPLPPLWHSTTQRSFSSIMSGGGSSSGVGCSSRGGLTTSSSTLLADGGHVRLGGDTGTPLSENAMCQSIYGTGRWPRTHWCNFIKSHRVAPSATYLYELRSAFFQAGLHAYMSDEATALLASLYGIYRVVGTEDIHPAPYPVRDCVSDPLEATTWYLAYGSNLSWEQVCLRIGPAYRRRPVMLHNWVLVPNKVPYSAQYASFGYYNIEPASLRRRKEKEGKVRHKCTMPDYVFGAAYEISMAQLRMMDNYEGGYRRQQVLCEDASTSGLVECWAYIAEETSESLLPSKEYLARVLEGADILPMEYMDGIRNTETNPLRSPRHERRVRKEL